jgi:hypothetical protein
VPNHALDSHLAAVASILAESRVVPFLDAGVNCAGRAPGVVWEEPGRELPTGGELADKASLEEHHSDLARVSRYVTDADLTDCVEQLGERLAKELRGRPGIGDDVAAVV